MKMTYLNDRTEVITRLAKREDAKDMIDFYNIVGGETDFLSFGKNEFTANVNSFQDYIEATMKENNSIILISTIDDKIIAISSINSKQKSKSMHVGVVGIVISLKYCGQGLGEVIMNYLIDFAKRNGITKKLSLNTNEENTRAIKLYEKLGFKREGLLIKENFVNGVYRNIVLMGLLL